MSEEITVRPDAPLTTPSFLKLPPEQMKKEAYKIAKILGGIIDDCGFKIEIQGKEYVKAEGWAALGNFAGITPVEKEVKHDGNGNYCAYIDLIDVSTGMKVGAGSAICGKDEPLWSKRPNYARRSMAITRATSKAYKTIFSWVIAIAGYASTPAEEMDNVVYEQRKRSRPKPLTDAIPPVINVDQSPEK